MIEFEIEVCLGDRPNNYSNRIFSNWNDVAGNHQDSNFIGSSNISAAKFISFLKKCMATSCPTSNLHSGCWITSFQKFMVLFYYWFNLSNNLTKPANFETYWFIIYHFCPAKNGFFTNVLKITNWPPQPPADSWVFWVNDSKAQRFIRLKQKVFWWKKQKKSLSLSLLIFLRILRKDQH